MNPTPPRLAVLGATGAVGSRLCRLLEDRNFPFSSIRFFGSPAAASQDRQIEFGDRKYPVEPLVRESIQEIDLAIASTPDEVARECAPWIVRQGGLLVDESAAHRMDSGVPLVVPEVNAPALANHSGIVASPNCSTIQLVMCLHPIAAAVGIRRVVVSTWQAASGAGEQARQELLEGTRALLRGEEPVGDQFEHPLPLDLWPKIGSLQDNGQTSEEVKMLRESRKILDLPELAMQVTCVRVPVVQGHSESVVVETCEPIDPRQARELFEQSPGISVVDEPGLNRLPTPRQCAEQDDVFVGRAMGMEAKAIAKPMAMAADNLRNPRLRSGLSKPSV